MTTTRLPARFRLLDGYGFPRLINGCWQLSHGHARRPIDRERTLRQLENLVRAGLTTFDCADIYTGVEDLLGELQRRVEPEGLDIQVHTKCVPDREVLPKISKRYIEEIVDRSLERLGTERLDLVQFHWWDFDVPGWLDAALWLDDLRREGKIARLGLTNTDVPHLAEILEAGVPIVVNQVQYSVLDRRPEHGLAAFCVDQGVQLICYGTVGGGFLTERYLDVSEPETPLPNRSLVKYRQIVEELGGWNALQALLRALAEVAARHQVSIANVAMRWVLDRPAVGAVVIGTVDDRHLDSNLELFDLELEVEDRARIARVLEAVGETPGDVYALERDWDGPHGRLLRTDLNSDGD